MFRVWGVNYDHDGHGEHGRLIEDYWHEEWDTVRADFREIKELGANVVRIHLQLGRFMSAPDRPNPKSLRKLQDLVKLSEELELYLDITGLGCYHKKDIPAWYDSLTEGERWEVQATFWAAIAEACRTSPAVFCYDLMNEPIIDGKKEEGWLAGELGGKHFVQRLTLDRGKRTNVEIAREWVSKLVTAVRAKDPHTLITVGAIPWAAVWPNAKPLFYSPEVSPLLDFVSIHVYPKAGELDKALAALAVYDIGKPLLIEETFPLSCSLEEMKTFLQASRSRAEGYVSFYWGRTIDELSRREDISSAITRQWLDFFKRVAPEMKAP